MWDPIPRPQAALKVGYVLKRFPRLSETFILNEILELERQGVEVEIFSLLQPPPEPRHALLSTLRARVTYLPARDAMKSWRLHGGDVNGDLLEVGLKDRLGEAAPLAELFPGKTPAKVAHLVMQATTLAMLASTGRIAHLHAHFGSNATTVALLASRLSGIPFSFTAHARDIYHTYVDKQVDDDLRARKIAEARFVVTVSDYNRHVLAELARSGEAGKIHRLYNGIDLSRFRPDSNDRGSDLILGVGRLVEKKGFPSLVAACRLLHERGRAFRCLIVGDGPERQSLEHQIREADLDGRVILAGLQRQEELIATMRRAAVVVLPCIVSGSGDRDGLPTVLLEALATGKPAVSTTVAGVPEIIDHGRNGLLVSPNQPHDLAKALWHVLSQPELGLTLGRNGRAKAERDFDLRRNVATLREYFARSADGGSFILENLSHENCLRHSG